MDDDADEIDIQLRSATNVGRRMIALSAVSHRVSSATAIGSTQDDDPDDEEEDDPDNADDVASESFDWVTWLTQEGILDALTAAERELLTAAPGISTATGDDEATAGESLGALAWAVARSPLTVLDRGYPYLALLDAVPSPWDDTAPFLTGLALRPESEIALAREAVEILSWRAQVEVERRRAGGRERSEIERAIRDVSAEAAAAGVGEIGPDGDLSIGGESIAALTDSLVISMAAAARARLRAMNWLCGLGDWDDPALTDI